MVEILELLVNMLYEVWNTAEDIGRNVHYDEDNDYSIRMTALPQSLIQAKLISTMKTLLMESEAEEEPKKKNPKSSDLITINEKEGKLRQVLNGALGEEKGKDCAMTLLEWMMWTLTNPWNEILATVKTEEDRFLDIYWNALLTTKYGNGKELLNRLQSLRFNNGVGSGTARYVLLNELLNACPELN